MADDVARRVHRHALAHDAAFPDFAGDLHAIVAEVEALRSVVRRLCVRALDDSPVGCVVDVTEARWFNPTPLELAAVRSALAEIRP